MGGGVASTALISIDTYLFYVYHRCLAHVLHGLEDMRRRGNGRLPVIRLVLNFQHEAAVLGLHGAGVVWEDLGKLLNLGSGGLNGALKHQPRDNF